MKHSKSSDKLKKNSSTNLKLDSDEGSGGDKSPRKKVLSVSWSRLFIFLRNILAREMMSMMRRAVLPDQRRMYRHRVRDVAWRGPDCTIFSKSMLIWRRQGTLAPGQKTRPTTTAATDKASKSSTNKRKLTSRKERAVEERSTSSAVNPSFSLASSLPAVYFFNWREQRVVELEETVRAKRQGLSTHFSQTVSDN